MVSIFWLAVLGEGSEPGTWPEPRELPKRSLRHGTAARELIAPQNMPAVERYRLGSANEKEAGRLVSWCGARRELRLAASDWRALHAAGRGARWQMSNEGL